MEEKHITQAELARRWRLSPRTLERWRWQGNGPAYLKIGGRIVYRKEDVAEFEIRAAEDQRKQPFVADGPAKNLCEQKQEHSPKTPTLRHAAIRRTRRA